MSSTDKGSYAPVRDAEYDDDDELLLKTSVSLQRARILSFTSIILFVSNIVFVVLWIQSSRQNSASTLGCVRPQLVHCQY
jgi:hypothetical protein